MKCSRWEAVSNHECEAIGVLAAIKLAKGFSSLWPQGKDLFIFVDSKGVIERMKSPLSPKVGQYIFLHIQEALGALPGTMSVNLVWCPGHVEIKGNETVDGLAKQAANDPEAPVFVTRGNKNKIIRMVINKGFGPRQALPPPPPSSCFADLSTCGRPLPPESLPLSDSTTR